MTRRLVQVPNGHGQVTMLYRSSTPTIAVFSGSGFGTSSSGNQQTVSWRQRTRPVGHLESPVLIKVSEDCGRRAGHAKSRLPLMEIRAQFYLNRVQRFPRLKRFSIASKLSAKCLRARYNRGRFHGLSPCSRAPRQFLRRERFSYSNRITTVFKSVRQLLNVLSDTAQARSI